MAADWVLVTEVVKRAIQQLRAQSVHEFFPAYLHLRQQSAVQATQDEIKPEWKKELAPFFEVAGAPAKKPYFRPFRTGGVEEAEWLNENLAGSYSPSSLRDTPRHVVEIHGSGASGRFGLKTKHWELARTHLLNEVRMPAWAVAAFMLRDYAWENFDSEPGYGELEEAFAEVFGYEGADTPEFEHLYDRTPATVVETWFEPFPAGAT